MKKLLIALLFFPLLSSAESVYQKTIHCFTQQELSSELSKYGEKPVFDFPNDITEKQSNIIMFLNKNWNMDNNKLIQDGISVCLWNRKLRKTKCRYMKYI